MRVSHRLRSRRAEPRTLCILTVLVLAGCAFVPRAAAQQAGHIDAPRVLSTVGEKFRVKVSTRPAGGIVAVIEETTYRMHLNRRAKGKTEVEEFPWRTLVQAREDLIGAYRFRVRWDSGKTELGKFSVMNAEDVILPSR